MSLHPRVCVSGISTWSWTLDEELALCASLGVPAIGLSLRKLDAMGWEAGVAAVRASGLKVANLIGVGPFELEHPGRWADQEQRVLAALSTATDVGAGCVVLTTGPAGALPWEAAADAFAAALAPVLPAFAERGVRLALEHTHSLRVDVGFVHTLRDVVDLAARLGTGVCMEVNACWAERGLASTVREAVGAGSLELVQVSDFAIGTRTTPERLVPGDGDIPLRRILGDVLAAGYAGWFDLELIGPAIEAEGYPSAVGRSVRWLSDALEELLPSSGTSRKSS